MTSVIHLLIFTYFLKFDVASEDAVGGQWVKIIEATIKKIITQYTQTF